MSVDERGFAALFGDERTGGPERQDAAQGHGPLARVASIDVELVGGAQRLSLPAWAVSALADELGEWDALQVLIPARPAVLTRVVGVDSGAGGSDADVTFAVAGDFVVAADELVEVVVECGSPSPRALALRHPDYAPERP